MMYGIAIILPTKTGIMRLIEKVEGGRIVSLSTKPIFVIHAKNDTYINNDALSSFITFACNAIP